MQGLAEGLTIPLLMAIALKVLPPPIRLFGLAAYALTATFLQAIGAPMVVMPLLMIATNAVVPQEGPFAAALINTPRALAELTAMWLVAAIQRWRGAFHTERLEDSLGRAAFAHPPGSAGPLTPEAGHQLLEQQSALLTTADAFRIVAAIAVLMMLVILVLPRRSYPPRIQFAKD